MIMTDNLSDPNQQNPNRINIRDDRAVRFWTGKFGCSNQQLAQAVEKVGPKVGAVRAELGRKAPLRPLVASRPRATLKKLHRS
jgi:hypothetical protein